MQAFNFLNKEEVDILHLCYEETLSLLTIENKPIFLNRFFDISISVFEYSISEVPKMSCSRISGPEETL